MSADAPVWPDEATVEKARKAIRADLVASMRAGTGVMGADPARAALSVLPDPTADTVLLAKVREIVEATSERMEHTITCGQPLIAEYHAAKGFAAVAALLAGGDR